MNSYEYVKMLVDEKNNSLSGEYVLLKYSDFWEFALVKHKNTYGTFYCICHYSYCEGKWFLNTLRSFANKEKAYAVFEVLTSCDR